VILDTAGYGPFTINKSIKVIGPSGVYGGISVQGAGTGLTTGIVINAGDTDVVTLRGLAIARVPSGAPFPDAGIDIQNAGAVHIERSSISNFAQDASACIRIVTGNSIEVYVNDSFLRECRDGIFVSGNGPTDTLRVNLVVDNTRIEHGLKKIVPEVIMHPAHGAGTATRLAVDDKGSRDGDEVAKTKGESFLESGANGATTHLIERRAIPPSLHVRLAKRKRAAGENTREEGHIMNLDVLRPGAVNLDISRAKKILDCPPRRCHRISGKQNATGAVLRER
jgi:hypothetical protein